VWNKLFFSLIIIFAIVSRFLFIKELPPIFDNSVLLARYITAFLSVGSIFLLFLILITFNLRIKLIFLTIWTMAVLPWSIEQGRIFSQVSNALFFCLLFFLLIQKTKNFIFKILKLSFIPFFLYFIYPQFWIFQLTSVFRFSSKLLNNIFIIVSPDFLFFRNITFWWGGIKEFGIMYVSFLPMFMYGLYRLIIEKKYSLFIIFIFLVIISAASPFFPESREFFLSIPLISLIVGKGMYQFLYVENKWIKFMFWILIILVIYEISQYFHYYSVHYKQEIIINQREIHEAF